MEERGPGPRKKLTHDGAGNKTQVTQAKHRDLGGNLQDRHVNAPHCRPDS